MLNIIDLFRPKIQIGSESFVCRLKELPDVLCRRNKKIEPWVPATDVHLSAYEAKYLPGDRPPRRPILAFGSGVKGLGQLSGYLCEVPFVGIDNRAPGVFPGGLRSHGRAIISKDPGNVLNRYTDVLERQTQNAAALAPEKSTGRPNETESRPSTSFVGRLSFYPHPNNLISVL